MKPFQLAFGSSLAYVAPTLLNGQKSCFVSLNGETRTHDFIQFVQNDDGFSARTLVSLDENRMLHQQWNFQFSSFLYSAHKNDHGDEYFFTLKYGSSENHAFIFLRPDGTLGALEFLNSDDDTFSTNVLTISHKFYPREDYYFYGALKDCADNKDILLCKSNKTQQIFMLSLEKSTTSEFQYEFKETLVTLATENEKTDAHTALAHFLSDDGFSDRQHELIGLGKNRNGENTGIPAQVLVTMNDTGDKSLYEFSFQKTADGTYVPIFQQNQLHHKETQKKPIFLGATGINDIPWDKVKEYLNDSNMVLIAIGTTVGAIVSIVSGIYLFNPWYAERKAKKALKATLKQRYGGTDSEKIVKTDFYHLLRSEREDYKLLDPANRWDVRDPLDFFCRAAFSVTENGNPNQTHIDDRGGRYQNILSQTKLYLQNMNSNEPNDRVGIRFDLTSLKDSQEDGAFFYAAELTPAGLQKLKSSAFSIHQDTVLYNYVSRLLNSGTSENKKRAFMIVIIHGMTYANMLKNQKIAEHFEEYQLGGVSSKTIKPLEEDAKTKFSGIQSVNNSIELCKNHFPKCHALLAEEDTAALQSSFKKLEWNDSRFVKLVK